MSFFDTLKQYGLWPQQQGGQGQANPYGLDEGMMRQARMQSLSNLGAQIMAASVKQTPRQRAELMSNFDMTGGYQDNLYNAAQMKLLSSKMRAAQQEEDQAEKIRISLGRRIAATPPGPLRDAAMWFYESGDYAKAGDLLFKRERVFDPMTGQDILVDAFQNPIGAPPLAAGVGSPGPASGGGSVMPAPGGAPAPAGQPSVPAAPGGVPAMPAVQEPVDQLTINWRQLTGDPNMTLAEARQAMLAAKAAGNASAGIKYHQEAVKQRQEAVNKDEDQARQGIKDQAEMANSVLDDRRSEMELPQRVVDFAQSIEDTLQMGDPTSMRALATQVLFAKVLDPGSAFMTGEADLQQSAASVRQRLERYLATTTEGTPLPKELVIEMRDIARQLGRRALTKLERIDAQAKTRAGAFNLTDDMLGGKFPLRWNRFADPGLPETARIREGQSFSREPAAQVLNDIENYGG
jgi:hypothetical protein